MQYDFQAPVDRSQHCAAKHDERERNFGRQDVIPLWIADMDLPTAQPIVEAVQKRAAQGLYGYTSRPDSYFQSVCDWQRRRHSWQPDPALCSFNVGVVPAISGILQELTEPGDKILFQTPVYPCFFSVVKNCGRQVLQNPLKQQQGRYVVDLDHFEQMLRQKPKFFLLCSPHNPVGRVWTREELVQMGELCRRYGVMVIADEIHADLLLWGNRHIPYASLGEEFAQNSITCISATKTFNLAGLQASTTVYPDQGLKRRMDTFWNRLDITRNNCFSLVAVQAAYRHGEEWLAQAIGHIEQNMQYVASYLQQHIPAITTYLPESTYLMWLDCRGLGLQGDAYTAFMVDQAGLGLNDGRSFGAEAGFFRMNVACPHHVLQQALQQLLQAVEALQK